MLKRMLPRLSQLPVLFAALLSLSILHSHAASQLPTVDSETLDEKAFVFPKDLKGEKHNVILLALTETQENGMAQQEALLKWEAAIRESGGLPNNQNAYYFIVMESPPFFVKGFIRKDMKQKFSKNVALNQLGILFIDDLKAFSQTAGLALDGEPTIVVASKTGAPLVVIKGAVTPEKLQQLKTALVDKTP